MQSSSCWSFKIVELSLQISKEQCSVILCNTAVMTPVHDSNPRMCGHLKPDNPVHTAVFFFFVVFPRQEYSCILAAKSSERLTRRSPL